MRAVVFRGQRQIGVVSDELAPPAAGEVRVRALCSAISAGTELLAYRGELPASMPVDPHLGALGGTFTPPFRFGYALVGEITACGAGVDVSALGQRVFAFAPHASEHNLRYESLVVLPSGLSNERALFLSNCETAVSLLHDGAPLLGERVLVMGQGVVGLLTTGLLTQLGLGEISVVEPDAFRGSLSERAFGAQVRFRLPAEPADLAFELSGNPVALQQAIDHTAAEGRVVVGAWYGDKPVELNLGRHFHRARVRLVSSQVSQIAGALRPRWDHRRRLALALQQLERLQPEAWITHRIDVEHAADAYRLLDERSEPCLQVVLTY